MYNLYNEGWIEVICGCMFAGKSTELIRRVQTLAFAKKKVAIFKPSVDTRYSETEVVTHDGNKIKCYSIKDPSDILKLKGNVNAIAVDEVQFFDNSIVDVCEQLANEGIRVIVAGLDLDYTGKPFGPIPELLARAEFVTKLTAVCVECGAPATRTERISSGKGKVELGAADKYVAKCRKHHHVH